MSFPLVRSDEASETFCPATYAEMKSAVMQKRSELLRDNPFIPESVLQPLSVLSGCPETPYERELADLTLERCRERGMEVRGRQVLICKNMTDIDYKIEAKLRIDKLEGFMRLTLFRSPDPNDYDRGQSAGAEWDDALARADKLWGYTDARPLCITPTKREFAIRLRE